MTGLAGRVALVTGGSRGIGRAVAEALGAAGATVWVAYLERLDAARQTAEAIARAGGSARVRQLDVRDPEAAAGAVADALERDGRLDVLVTAAGVAPDGLFGHLREADWRLALETNLLGTVHCCRAAVPAMLRQGWGRIITVSSLSAVRGRPGITAYAASKGAVEAFTRALAAELAPRGVTVNALRPGWIVTDMTAPLEALAGPRLRQTIPARRAGSPAEVAAAAVFLASPAASYITGAVLDIAGGL